MDHQEHEQEFAAKLLLDYSSQIRDEFVNLSDRHIDQDISSCDDSTPNGSLESSSIPLSSSSASSIEHHHTRYQQHDTHGHYMQMPIRTDDSMWSNNASHVVQDVKDTTLPVIVPLPRTSLKFVAVHLGVGVFRKVNHDEFRRLAKDVCSNVMSMSMLEYDQKGAPLNSEPLLDAVEAVAQLVRQLEDNPLVNCGYGSNLNMRGTVECDASLMSANTQRWVGVGAVSGCKNPILLAKRLYDAQTIPRPLHLVQPNLLVGQGAKAWMREHCPHLATNDSQLISARALKIYCRLKSSYDAAVKDTDMDCITTTASTNSGLNKSTESNKCLINVYNEHNNGPESPDSSVQTQDECANELYSTNQTTNGSVIHPAELDHGSYCRKLKDLSSNHYYHNRQSGNSFQRKSYDNTSNRLVCQPPVNSRLESISNGCALTISSDAARSSSPEAHSRGSHIICEETHSLTALYNRADTVGAIAVDCDNNVACAISSGGIHLKANGRVGQAAIPGAGCWAQNRAAVTTSGVGEFISTTLLARQLHQCLTRPHSHMPMTEAKNNEFRGTQAVSEEIKSCLDNEFLSNPALLHVDPAGRMAGFLALALNSPNNLLLSYGHNTNEMCVGFMSNTDTEARSLISIKESAEESQSCLLSSSAPSAATNGEHCVNFLEFVVI